MATITKQKTLNDIDVLPSNTPAHILVLDPESKLKKVQIIGEDGTIPANLVDQTSILNANLALESKLNYASLKIEALEDVVHKMMENYKADMIDVIAKINTLSELIATKTASTTDKLEAENKIAASNTEAAAEKPVKKTRKTTKKAEKAE